MRVSLTPPNVLCEERCFIDIQEIPAPATKGATVEFTCRYDISEL